MKIYRATSEHLNDLVELFDQYRVWYKADSDKEAARKFLSERFRLKESVIFMIAPEGSPPQGFVQLYPIFSSVRMKRVWLLNDLFVHPDGRDKGLGTQLLNRAKAYCEETDHAGIMLETEKHNERGNYLYQREDFELEEHNLYFWTSKK